MYSKQATVAAKLGLHARPAAAFSRAAAQTGKDITISLGENSADAASLLEVMTLGANCGDVVTLSGAEDAIAAIDELVDFIENQE
ncbi:HPr family phosphocarrier protein [Arcanobacterium hippocoleae]|uniref:Phosphocarrier protein HPr n=1 Tax=Arcanobacterium hippocoleae TaxID=149017 RepID=A0ABU1T341_9ACTO|nr:HPr family phosphocarrier protein [Arcanobacterium hippocoleae]MDR6939779.1 phosphotransferase system HPr (HPr) family protein [Arcanobacterium hippocoleae]